jgi:hypothetical protein
VRCRDFFYAALGKKKLVFWRYRHPDGAAKPRSGGICFLQINALDMNSKYAANYRIPNDSVQ